MSNNLNTTIKQLENVIVLEVDNILQGWPSYLINFTPESTGPHKIILRLKNASKCVAIESDDEDDNAGAHPSAYTASMNNTGASIMVPSTCRNGPSQPYESDEESCDEDEVSSGEETPAETVSAIPIDLAGLPKDSAPIKRKIFDETWPPHRPHAFRKLSADSSIASYEAFMTWPAAVRAAKEDIKTGLDGVEAAEGKAMMKN